jgi:hypothetical protein
LYDHFGDGNESIFPELGFLNEQGALLCSVVMLEQMQWFGDSQATSGHQEKCHIHGELFEEGGVGSVHVLANGFEELIGLLGREDEGDANLFFERGDIQQRIFLKDSPANEETKEAPCGVKHMVHRGGLHGKIGSHVEEKGRVKGTPGCSALIHVTVKEAKVVIAGSSGISEAFPISDVVVKQWGQKALKGFHGKGPFSSSRRGRRDTFGRSGSPRGPASL